MKGKSANTLNATQNLDVTQKKLLTDQWKSIDWKVIQDNVNRIQTRIAKATISDDWRKVKQLQRLLVNSFPAKALAVKTVTSNSGKKTPGIDGEIWEQSYEKMYVINNITTKNYKSKPLKRVEIDKGKGDGSTRPLGIPTMYDRTMQKLWELALSPIAETKADTCSFGFRTGRSAQDAREQIFNILASSQNATWVLDADIKGFFDNLSHDWLMKNIPMDKNILKEFLKCGVVIKGKLYPTEKGTPQGGIISPTLANMALDGLQYQIQNKYWRKTYVAKHIENKKSEIYYKFNTRKVHFVRYADDFIITGIDRQTCEELKEHIKPFLTERGVEISENKTRIVHMEEGFDFLGWNFRKYQGKMLIKPSDKSVKKFLDEIRETIKVMATAKQSSLIYELNPKIRGWRNYQKSSVARKIFEKVDHEIWLMTWNWAIRRHRIKGKKWVKEKYWHKYGGNNWTFFDDTKELDKNNQVLIKCSNTKIIRHPKLKMDKNPFLDKEYFVERAFNQGVRNLTGDFKKIWKRQNGMCPFCNKGILIDSNEEYEIHHIVPRKWGGSDKPSNLIYMHKICHKLYHSNNVVRSLSNGNRLEIIEAYKPIEENREWKLLLSE